MSIYKTRILELHQQGNGCREISRIVGCAAGLVSYHISRKNIDTTLGKKGKLLSDEQKKQINQLYLEGLDFSEIVRNTGFSIQTIKKYLTVPKRQSRKLSSSEIALRHRRRLKEKLVEYKGGKCERCGYDKCIAALDFHHRDQKEKDFNIATTQLGFEKTKKEVDKCELVCSNCHREIHNC